ncbi:MAG: glycoside hydrolase family 16 protein [Terrimonas sp.]|nr:glycoside hydrolase family 16 protein [Terrimonas sp.]OJY95374.1 MAG: beta-glucanase [Sphingobacteriales bacterium 40-81]
MDFIKKTTVVLCLLTCNTILHAQHTYKLVWSDEFNKDGVPDSSKWNYEKGFVRNEEHQWYQPENAFCKNGLLIIEARREQKPNPLFKAGSNNWRTGRKNIEYTSACMITAGKHQWQYGKFELRARIDIDAGVWPAWWTLGVEKHWPANGEIDIMEFYRDTLLANILCRGVNNSNEWYTTKTGVQQLGGKAWASQFHTWRMDWTEEYVALYVDDSLLNKVAVEKLVNKDGSGFNPFKQPHYMLLNLAIGGQNGGDPSQTAFPKRMEVDWVRVWQE